MRAAYSRPAVSAAQRCGVRQANRDQGEGRRGCGVPTRERPPGDVDIRGPQVWTWPAVEQFESPLEGGRRPERGRHQQCWSTPTGEPPQGGQQDQGGEVTHGPPRMFSARLRLSSRGAVWACSHIRPPVSCPDTAAVRHAHAQASHARSRRGDARSPPPGPGGGGRQGRRVGVGDVGHQASPGVGCGFREGLSSWYAPSTRLRPVSQPASTSVG